MVCVVGQDDKNVKDNEDDSHGKDRDKETERDTVFKNKDRENKIQSDGDTDSVAHLY